MNANAPIFSSALDQALRHRAVPDLFISNPTGARLSRI